MRRLLAVVALLVAVGPLAAVAPPPLKADRYEIDFAPMSKVPSKWQGEWRMSIVVTGADGKATPVMVGVERPDVGGIVWHLAVSTSHFKGLDWASDRSGNKLLVKSYNGKMPASVQVSLTGIDVEYTPKVRLVPKE